MKSRSFVIIASNKSKVEEQISKLNKRANRFGLDEIFVTYGKAYLETREVISYNDSQSIRVKKKLLVLPVTITGPFEVKFNGWEFLATLQHLTSGENIIRGISDFEVPNKYKTTSSFCQHCNINRYRKDTYLVRHDDGDVLQVGSTCIKDFLGGNCPDNIIQNANFIADIIMFMEGSGYQESNIEPMLHIETFLALTSACIRDHGWVSKGKAYESNLKATAGWVHDNLFNKKLINSTNVSVVKLKDEELAKKASQWAENLSDKECDNSDYLHNIRAIARSGMVGLRTFGFAASIIPAYTKANEPKEDKNKDIFISEFVGKIKERKKFFLKLKRHFSASTMYGICNIYIFNDDSKNVLVWLTNSNQGLEVESSYNVTGTIKAHSVYNDTKQTVLTRCKIN